MEEILCYLQKQKHESEQSRFLILITQKVQIVVVWLLAPRELLMLVNTDGLTVLGRYNNIYEPYRSIRLWHPIYFKLFELLNELAKNVKLLIWK